MAETNETPPAWAKEIAHALIQGYIGPDHKVIKMDRFYSALTQALHKAYERGTEDEIKGRRTKPAPQWE